MVILRQSVSGKMHFTETSRQEAEICVENGDLSEDYENGDSFVCWTALEHQLFTEYGRVRTRKQARIAF